MSSPLDNNLSLCYKHKLISPMMRNTLRMPISAFGENRICFLRNREARATFRRLSRPSRAPRLLWSLFHYPTAGCRHGASVCKFSVSIANSQRKFVLLESSAISTTLVSTYSLIEPVVFLSKTMWNTRDCSKHLNPIVELKVSFTSRPIEIPFLSRVF